VLKTYNQTQKIVENGDGLGNNPGHNPNTKTDSDPGPNGEETPTVHLVGSTENAHVDVLTGNMAQDDSGKNSLCLSTGET